MDFGAGVYCHKGRRNKPFQSTIEFNRHKTSLGYYHDFNSANIVYSIVKQEVTRAVKNKYIYPVSDGEGFFISRQFDKINSYYGYFYEYVKAKKAVEILHEINWNYQLWGEIRVLFDEFRYIYPYKDGKYIIIKDNDYFGIFNNLYRAVRERNFLEKNKFDFDVWVEKRVDEI